MPLEVLGARYPSPLESDRNPCQQEEAEIAVRPPRYRKPERGNRLYWHRTYRKYERVSQNENPMVSKSTWSAAPAR